MPPRTIGWLAREAGVGVETIRLYERMRLLAQPRRPAGGFREYPEDAVARLRFIRHAQRLGFSLREIAGLLRLFEGGRMTCGEAVRHAARKLVEIRERIATLERMAADLVRLRDGCRACPDQRPCPAFSLNRWRRGVRESDPCCAPVRRRAVPAFPRSRGKGGVR